MKKLCLLPALALAPFMSFAQREATITLKTNEATQQISKHIYGHFAEHLGTCVYGGLWVGEDSKIPNTNGYRNDVLAALKELKVPVLRWPGGCFADEYHWMDGIGPNENRPKMVNNNWGGTIEDNSFGTHEFLNLCELLECEPYISGNVGSGTVEELAKWVEYMTSDGDSPMANLRRENGREKAWKVKFLGVGNESWGCGGDMYPDYYADLYRRYAVYCRNFDDNKLYKIASGASDYDYNWTETLMKKSAHQMNGLSLHYYTVKEWGPNKGSAIDFNKEDYYWTLGKAIEIKDVVDKHIAIMDKYDPRNRVGLLVDEWGTWFNEEPGTISGHLYQQNSLRCAMVASLTLDIFNQCGSRVQMANIAQVANVLQSVVLTKDEKMVLTPTYHVFNMYKVHQDATMIPLDLTSDKMDVGGKGNRTLPMLSASASKDAQGKINITMSNVDADNDQTVTINLPDVKFKNATATIITAKDISSHNTFEKPNEVLLKDFKGVKVEKNGSLKVKMPAKSIIAIQVN